nr:immunoglobulin heavy chain junction region [Mus musculus]
CARSPRSLLDYW